MKKMISRRQFIAAMGVVAAAGALAGCGGSGSSTTASTSTASSTAPTTPADPSARVEGGEMIFGTTDVLGEFFSPYKQNSLASYGWPAYQPLAWQREDQSWSPCLAESWERNDEACALIIHLVQNATFSDGTPLTAEDVVFSLGSRADYGTDSTIGSPTSVEAIDDYTVQITWSSFSLNYEQWVLGQFIFSKAAFDANGLDWMLNNMLGSGPYTLQEFIPDVSLTYVRNENYWGDQTAAPDTITFLYMSDATTMLAAFMNGEIDRMNTSDPTVVDQLTAAGYTPYESQSVSSEGQYLAIPLSIDPNDPLYKTEVRQAIFEYGIDWDTMAVGLGGSLGYHTDAIGQVGMTYYDPSIEKSGYDLEKAKQMLSDIGYPNGFTTTIYTSAEFSSAATMLQAGLAELGITADCQFVDYTLVQSDYIGAKATQTGICITCLFFPSTLQTDRFTKHINPTATYGASSTWDDEIQTLWTAVTEATTKDEEDAALLAYVDHYVHTGCWIWPMYNTSSKIFYQEWAHFTANALCGSSYDPMEMWTTRA